MKNAQKYVIRLSLLLALAMPLAACNTVEGLGEDAQAAGRGIENAASDNKSY